MTQNKKFIDQDIKNRFAELDRERPNTSKRRRKPWLNIIINVGLALIVLAGIIGSFLLK
ncbi:hypothetical protein [Fructilactobacillus florum]|uniref:DUF4044 domain-containing protein n=1 Tax=Fructilactobacillus florum DSM 22689 = JCM 16035 TaxID=1423745 RepID=A0A0R2CXM3_9LACO|nr:hypothetical protein [Fructilactobacillus florum]KRM92243.1 hypothetical protein FC87_GL000370 [Fructilactobacillus florum DSM 22689 = JCM 16035]